MGWGSDLILRYQAFFETGGDGNTPRVLPVSITELCLIIRNNDIYGLGVEI